MTQINDYTVKDMAWTLMHFYPDLCDLEPDEKLLKAMRAVAITAKVGYGDCFPVENFMAYEKARIFIPYDGSGYFCDENGNEICSVWSSDEVPENAKFVMWFNK